MRAGIDRAMAIVANRAAVQQHAPGLVDCLEFDPHVEAIDGSTRKEMTDFPRPHDDLDANGLTAPDRHRRLIKGAEDDRRRRSRAEAAPPALDRQAMSCRPRHA